MTQPLKVASLKLGEAGAEIGRDLVAAAADVRGYDWLVSEPAGVQPRSGEADAVRDAYLVLSVNSADDALPALAGLHARDLRNAAPTLKAALAQRAVELDVRVVDVASMSPVPGRGHSTPMLDLGPVRGDTPIFSSHSASR